MEIDPRLDQIDDCLYRVAVRALIVQDDKVLLVKEKDDEWWALPGGGVDHGETVQSTLTREVEEELGVPADKVTSDFKLAYYTIGSVVNAIPRMNLFFKATLPVEMLRKTSDVAEWEWFTKGEFLVARLHPSYDKNAIALTIFDT